MVYKRRAKLRCDFCHRSMAIGDKYDMINGAITCLAAECRCKAESLNPKNHCISCAKKSYCIPDECQNIS